MAQKDKGTTDRLAPIIASIKLERRSGQFIVRRGEGLALEEGVLLFAQGQVIQATVGRRSGSEAVNWVTAWRQASYVFLPEDAEKEVPAVPDFPQRQVARQSDSPGTPQAWGNVFKRELAPGMAFLSAVPSVTVDPSTALAKIDQAGLLRIYRLIYMLIDGYRCVGELAPMLGKSVEEVHTMLCNLEWLGIIRIARSTNN
ncbi:MAG: DUF4388 domain-containing protein [Ktedonobacteraceae bacterium]